MAFTAPVLSDVWLWVAPSPMVVSICSQAARRSAVGCGPCSVPQPTADGKCPRCGDFSYDLEDVEQREMLRFALSERPRREFYGPMWAIGVPLCALLLLLTELVHPSFWSLRYWVAGPISIALGYAWVRHRMGRGARRLRAALGGYELPGDAPVVERSS